VRHGENEIRAASYAEIIEAESSSLGWRAAESVKVENRELVFLDTMTKLCVSSM
jgi:hypothetical protein